MASWAESHEAVMAEQAWRKMEQDRHQRLLYQLRTELRAARGQERAISQAETELTDAASKAQPPEEVATPVKTRLPIQVKRRIPS